MIRVTALKSVPAFAQGLVRDLRARWALEEAGLPYETRLVDNTDKQTAEYRRMQPFGQVPILEEDELVLFESGAIALYIAEKSPALLPQDPAQKARATTWVFAALNSVEPQIQNLATIDLFSVGQEWAKLRRPDVMKLIRAKLSNLSDWLKDRQYLEETFTVGDLMMASVLRTPRHTTLLQEFPVLEAYVQRCEARPAFQKALAAQMADFERNAV